MMTPAPHVEETENWFDGKVAVVTGGTSGIGLALTKCLCNMGMTVVVGSVDARFAEEERANMTNFIKSKKLRLLSLDLASFKSIKEFYSKVTDKHHQIDYLINNAGIMLVPFSRTQEGFERHLGVNFIGHVYLTKLFLPNMCREDSIVVNLGSSTYKFGCPSSLLSAEFYGNPRAYSSHFQYAHSKLAVVLYTQALANFLREHNFKCSTISVHPGVVSTRLYQHVYYPLQVFQQRILAGICLRTADEGARVVLSAILNHDHSKNGAFFIFNEYRRLYTNQFNFDKFMEHIDEAVTTALSKIQ